MLHYPVPSGNSPRRSRAPLSPYASPLSPPVYAGYAPPPLATGASWGVLVGSSGGGHSSTDGGVGWSYGGWASGVGGVAAHLPPPPLVTLPAAPGAEQPHHTRPFPHAVNAAGVAAPPPPASHRSAPARRPHGSHLSHQPRAYGVPAAPAVATHPPPPSTPGGGTTSAAAGADRPRHRHEGRTSAGSAVAPPPPASSSACGGATRRPAFVHHPAEVLSRSSGVASSSAAAASPRASTSAATVATSSSSSSSTPPPPGTSSSTTSTGRPSSPTLFPSEMSYANLLRSVSLVEQGYSVHGPGTLSDAARLVVQDPSPPRRRRRGGGGGGGLAVADDPSDADAFDCGRGGRRSDVSAAERRGRRAAAAAAAAVAGPASDGYDPRMHAPAADVAIPGGGRDRDHRRVDDRGRRLATPAAFAAAPLGGWAGLDPTAYTFDVDDTAAAAAAGASAGGGGSGSGGIGTRRRRDLDGEAQAKIRRYKDKLWRAQRDSSYAVKTPVIEWKLGYVYWKHGHMEQPTAQRFVATGGVMPDVSGGDGLDR
ncbi:hypothetical protein MMPV_004821 [Pyropia vietnamensis]